MIVPNICQMTWKRFCPVLVLEKNSRFPPVWTRFCMPFQFRKLSSTKTNFFFFVRIGKHILRKWRIVRFCFHFLKIWYFLSSPCTIWQNKIKKIKNLVEIWNFQNIEKYLSTEPYHKNIWSIYLVPFLITCRLENCAGCCQMLYSDHELAKSGFFENILLLSESKVTKIILTAKQP